VERIPRLPATEGRSRLRPRRDARPTVDTAAAAVGAVEVTATATSNPARTKSLRKLPAGQLLIGTGGNPRQLFDLIGSAEIEQRAWAVTTSTDCLEAQDEAWAQELMARGEWPPADDERP
jgi:hypothetical protein